MTSEAVTLRAKLFRLVTEFGDASMDYGIFGGSDNSDERRADAMARLSATRIALHDAIYEVCDRLRDHEDAIARHTRAMNGGRACSGCGNPLVPARHPDAAKHPEREYAVCINERCLDHRVFVWRPREPTPDEQGGMDWWNALSESERGKWLERVGGDASAADAWALYKKADLVFRAVVAIDRQLTAIEKGGVA